MVSQAWSVALALSSLRSGAFTSARARLHAPRRAIRIYHVGVAGGLPDSCLRNIFLRGHTQGEHTGWRIGRINTRQPSSSARSFVFLARANPPHASQPRVAGRVHTSLFRHRAFQSRRAIMKNRPRVHARHVRAIPLGCRRNLEKSSVKSRGPVPRPALRAPCRAMYFH